MKKSRGFRANALNTVLRLKSEFERGVEVFEEGMSQVFFREDGFSGVNPPVYGEGFVEDGDAAVGFGMVTVVAFVLEYGDRAEDGEAVCETMGDEELAVVVFGEFDCYVPPECGGAFSDVYGYVEDGAFYAAD